MAIERLTIPIYGLGCGGGGALSVERALTKLAGVSRVYVNPMTEMAYIECDPSITNRDQLVGAVKHVGFDAGLPKAH